MPKISYTADSDVIFTSYFTSKENPQKTATGQTLYAPRNDINFIYPWYATICHLGLNGVVIHDGLSKDFIKEYSRSNVQFYEYHPNRYSLNDERYFALREILNQQCFRHVMMTDGSDLIFKKNPFEFMTQDILYFGTDEPSSKKIRDNKWCIQKMIQLHESGKGSVEIDNGFFDFEYINAGVMAGSYKNMTTFIESLTLLFEILNSDKNNNMMAINYLLWKFSINHFKGIPFTSPFKKHELHGDYYIVHK
jgi:hypothetical protein